MGKAVKDAAVDTFGCSTRAQGCFDSNDAEIRKLLNERKAAFAAKLRNPTSVELHRRLVFTLFNSAKTTARNGEYMLTLKGY